MQENDVEIYSTHNEFIVSERVIRMLRIKNYEYVNSLLQDVYNDKDLIFKVGDYVRISIYKNIFGKVQNGQKQIFGLKMSKLLYHGHMK